MLSVELAQKTILEHARPLPAVAIPLNSAALGRVLAEDVASDLDLPPFDKALMDGYAVRSADLSLGSATLDVIEEVTAGQTPRKNLEPRQATRIMTGAPIPQGADAVIMVERSRLIDERRVHLEESAQPGKNILYRGREMRAGEVVLRAGIRLRPQEIGVLASVGRATIRVHPAPVVAVVPTGDEIVPVQQKPGPGQIRNSNGLMLESQAARAGGVPRLLDIARDNRDHLRGLVAEGLKADALVLSGGVSAGKLDLVPEVLAELGVEALFHKVEMKPGKPMLFGIKKKAAGVCLVFGLPGNPLSSLVCFELFARPALRRLAGQDPTGPTWVEAELTEDYAYRSDRPTYHPVRLKTAGCKRQFQAVPWSGSSDLRSVLPAQAFALFPAGEHLHRAGQVFPVMLVEDQ